MSRRSRFEVRGSVVQRGPQREATFGCPGIETGRQLAGETYREVSVLTDTSRAGFRWSGPFLPRATRSPLALPSFISALAFNCVCDGDRDVHSEGSGRNGTSVPSCVARPSRAAVPSRAPAARPRGKAGPTAGCRSGARRRPLGVTEAWRYSNRKLGGHLRSRLERCSFPDVRSRRATRAAS